ncbi:MAG: TIGR03013 family PEP-CTERM/XrtA system glycosyltransferase [Aquimonas sp.]|nr:TIGR03013 family PEP-CTERM/XrtA system glycosyltransferase [Aquimonas sp.]
MRSLTDALHPARRWILILALIELSVLVAVFHIAVWLRFLGDEAVRDLAFGEVGPRALLFAMVHVLAMTAMGMYISQSREGLRGHVVRAAVAFMAGGLVLVALQYLMPVSPIGRGVMFLAMLLGFVSIVLTRLLALRSVGVEAVRRRVLVLGAGHKAELINTRLRRLSDRRTFQIVGFVPMPGDADAIEPAMRLDPEAGLLANLCDLDVDEIVIAVDERRGILPMDELIQARLRGIAITELGSFFEHESGKVKMNVVSPSWLVFSSGFNAGAFRSTSKRAFDIAAAGLLLVLAAPLMALTALLIWVESGFRGSIIYRQERVGQGGVHFRVLKFRSMREDAEKDGVARWAQTDDDRITRVGRVIRKLRIDELPQVLNVLRGAMSFVGPRPERPSFVDQLTREIPYYALRHTVKPGITGWAQLRYAYGASVKDAEEKLKYDLYYVKNHSLMFDLLVLLQTFEVVIFGKGAR